VSSNQTCEIKNVAPNPYSFKMGATTVRCDITASSNVRTTVLSGTGADFKGNIVRIIINRIIRNITFIKSPLLV
jgi:hypothetical protein